MRPRRFNEMFASVREMKYEGLTPPRQGPSFGESRAPEERKALAPLPGCEIRTSFIRWPHRFAACHRLPSPVPSGHGRIGAFGVRPSSFGVGRNVLIPGHMRLRHFNQMVTVRRVMTNECLTPPGRPHQDRLANKRRSDQEDPPESLIGDHARPSLVHAAPPNIGAGGALEFGHFRRRRRYEINSTRLQPGEGRSVH